MCQILPNNFDENDIMFDTYLSMLEDESVKKFQEGDKKEQCQILISALKN